MVLSEKLQREWEVVALVNNNYDCVVLSFSLLNSHEA